MSDRSVEITDQNKYLLTPPPIERSAYSDRTAWLMALLSNLAYIRFEDNTAKLQKLAGELGKLDLEIVALFHAERVDVAEMDAKERIALKDRTKTDTQGMLVQSSEIADHKFAALVFRGSEFNKTDWITTDADAVFVNLGQDSDHDGKWELVHRGFYSGFVSVREAIETVLGGGKGGFRINDTSGVVAAAYNPSLPFYVSGHSLGAALATVAARELELRKKHNIAAVYTFGSPRVGNPEWAATLKCPVFRVVNRRDAVALLPPSSFLGNLFTRMGWGAFVEFARKHIHGFIGYQHVGDIRFLTGKGELKKGSDAAIERLLAVFFDLGWGIWRRSFRLVGVVLSLGIDHTLAQYIPKLEDIAKKRNPQ